MSTASHCEIERDLGNPYSVELATSMFGFMKKNDSQKKVTGWQARTAKSGSSDDAASDSHSAWLRDAHSDIQKQQEEADQKHAKVHADIKDKKARLERASKLDIEHKQAMKEHAQLEHEKQKILELHESKVQGAHAKSSAASRAAAEARNEYMGASTQNAEASSDMGRDTSHWGDIENHERNYAAHHASFNDQVHSGERILTTMPTTRVLPRLGGGGKKKNKGT